MTYLGFLVSFIVVPIILILVGVLFDHRAWKNQHNPFSKLSAGFTFLVLVVLAVLYTTPWDNYLVASQVWWYDPSLVLGITLGWVPLEEYLFFLLQPILGGLWLVYIQGRISQQDSDRQPGANLRRWSVMASFLIWTLVVGSLLAGQSPITYLGLELAWAFPVIILQLAFGADILWRHRHLIIIGVVPLTLYLSFSDAIAIQSGVWTINPDLSLGILIGGLLPVEEFIFFLLTNIMVMFGFVLVWSQESQTRLKGMWDRFKIFIQKPMLSEKLR